ncbi:MAG: hypothetical protein KatS3mg105_2474 [Gemmatales bacterium]|nr:MAG: hypothetical protein KatS3mg105_2474 [Gemmatales bacterium]
MFYQLQTEFANPNLFGFRDAFIGFRDVPILQTVIIGNQKRPLSLDQLNSSNHNVFIERPLPAEAFNENNRRIGIAAYGYAENGRATWTHGIYNLENIQNDGSYRGDARQLSFNNRLSILPWYDETSDGRGYLHLAIANMIARPDGQPNVGDTNVNEARWRSIPELASRSRWIDTGRIAGADLFDTLGLEAMLNIGPFSIVSEYINNWVSRDSGSSLYFHGAYVYVAYWLTGEHQPYNKRRGVIGQVKPFENFFLVERCRGGWGGGWGAWQIAARYSYLDLTDNDIRGGVEDNVTFGLNWIWNTNARMQFNYVIGKIRDRQPVNGFTGGSFTGISTRLMVYW